MIFKDENKKIISILNEIIPYWIGCDYKQLENYDGLLLSNIRDNISKNEDFIYKAVKSFEYNINDNIDIFLALGTNYIDNENNDNNMLLRFTGCPFIDIKKYVNNNDNILFGGGLFTVSNIEKSFDDNYDTVITLTYNESDESFIKNMLDISNVICNEFSKKEIKTDMSFSEWRNNLWNEAMLTW